jgi:hypothetical protein
MSFRVPSPTSMSFILGGKSPLASPSKQQQLTRFSDFNPGTGYSVDAMSFSKSLLDANNATEESRILTHPNERLMYKALESTSWQRCWVADNHELKR